jgi:arsenate reductase (glutaredoxin)
MTNPFQQRSIVYTYILVLKMDSLIMPNIRLYYNSKCSKSRQALQLLQQHNIEPELIHYLKLPLNVQQIIDLLKKLDIPAINLLRKNEGLFSQLNLQQATEETLIETLSQHPHLLQRPIAVNGNRAIIARPPERIEEIL